MKMELLHYVIKEIQLAHQQDTTIYIIIMVKIQDTNSLTL